MKDITYTLPLHAPSFKLSILFQELPTFPISCSGQWSLLKPKLDYIGLAAFTLNLKTGAQEAGNKEVFEELSLGIQNGDSTQG